MSDLELLYINTENISEMICQFGIVFCGGFMLAVILHLIAYGVFGLLSLLNIK